MEEHEVKILEVNRKEVEKKLIKLGAKKIFDGNLQTIFFDFNDKSILKNKKEGGVFNNGEVGGGGGGGGGGGLMKSPSKKFSSQISKACRIYPQHNHTPYFFIS